MADFNAYLSQLERERGLPAGYLSGAAKIESNNGTVSDRSGSQFKGMFQLGQPIRDKFGVKDASDPYQSARGAADYAAENAPILRKALGRDPTPLELYMAHQQGAGGATALLTHPLDPAGSVANPGNIKSNNGNPDAPAKDFVNKWATAFNGAPQEVATLPVAPAASGLLAADGSLDQNLGGLPSTPPDPVKAPGLLDSLMNSKDFMGQLDALTKKPPSPPTAAPAMPAAPDMGAFHNAYQQRFGAGSQLMASLLGPRGMS